MAVGKKNPKILRSFIIFYGKVLEIQRHSDDSKSAIFINTFFDAKLDKK